MNYWRTTSAVITRIINTTEVEGTEKEVHVEDTTDVEIVVKILVFLHTCVKTMHLVNLRCEWRLTDKVISNQIVN